MLYRLRESLKTENQEPHTADGQHEASMRVEGEFREELFSRTSAQIQALIRSQAGPGAGRWSGMLACTAARAVVSSLLDLQHCHGGDGTTPHAHEVDGDHRCAGLRAQF